MMTSDIFFPLTFVVKRIMKMCFWGVLIMIYKNKITGRNVNLFYHYPVTQKSRTCNKECKIEFLTLREGIVFGRVLNSRSQ